jgi:elongator complex protein 4
VIDSNPRQFVSECMWSSNGVLSPSVTTEVEDKEDGNETTKVEIAWRYEHLKPFQTTVSASKLYVY